MLAELRTRMPNTDVILLGILPRDAHVLSGPPEYEWPNRMSEAISNANHALQVSSMLGTNMQGNLLCGLSRSRQCRSLL